MGAGLRPEAKAEDEPPDPTVRAPVLDPTDERGVETEPQPPRHSSTLQHVSVVGPATVPFTVELNRNLDGTPVSTGDGS